MFFHLMDIVFRFPLLLGVLQSITKNVNQLLSVGMLIIVVVYVISIGYFIWFFNDLKMGVENNYSNKSLASMIFVVVEQGMRNGGGVGDAMHDKYKAGTEKQGKDSLGAEMVWRWFLDMMFFISIVLILMNVLFGIIVDSFGALREEKNFQKEDRVNLCFVCGLKRDMFDRYGLVSFD